MNSVSRHAEHIYKKGSILLRKVTAFTVSPIWFSRCAINICTSNTIRIKPTFRPYPSYFRYPICKYSSEKEEHSEFEKLAYELHFIRINNLGQRLKLAGLFRQVTEGPNNTPEPDAKDPYEHAHWRAWKLLGEMSKEHAEKEYIRLAKERLQKRDPDIFINN